METIAQLLEEKGRRVWTVGPYTSVYDALALMAEKEIGALMVMDRGEPVGLVSERDYARNVILKGRSSRETPVKDIMTTPVVQVSPDQTVRECMAIITRRRIRHLPVMVDGRLEGLISIGDLVKAIIEDQRQVIEHLEHYIAG